MAMAENLAGIARHVGIVRRVVVVRVVTIVVLVAVVKVAVVKVEDAQKDGTKAGQVAAVDGPLMAGSRLISN